MVGLFAPALFEPDLWEVEEPAFEVVGGGYVTHGAYSKRQKQLKAWLTPLQKPPVHEPRRRRRKKPSERPSLDRRIPPLPDVTEEVIQRAREQALEDGRRAIEEAIERERQRQLSNIERARLLEAIREQAAAEQEAQQERIRAAIATAQAMHARELEAEEEAFIIQQVLEIAAETSHRRNKWLVSLLGPRLMRPPAPQLGRRR